MTDRYRNDLDPMYFAGLCAAVFAGTALLVIAVLAIAPGHVWETFGIAVAVLWLFFFCPIWWYRYEEVRPEEETIERR